MFINTSINTINMKQFTNINVSLNIKLLDKIEKKRKDMPRSRFIARALESYLGVSEKEATKYE